MAGFGVDTRKFERGLDDFASKQMPFVVAATLTDVAFRIRKELPNSAEKVFDRQTPFTKRAYAVKKANKRDNPIQSSVFVLPAQQKYLGIQSEGGKIQRGDPGTIKGDILEPVNARLNKYGNLPSGPVRYLAKQLSKENVLVKRIRGRRSGVFERKKVGGRAKLNLLVTFDPDRTVKPIFDFPKLVAPLFDKDIQRVFAEKFNRFVR